MTPEEQALENQVKMHRRQRRLLYLQGVHFKATRADFKTVCREKLSMAIGFHWPEANREGNTHRGWLYLSFESRPDRAQAEEKLKRFKFRGRDIRVEKSKRLAVSGLETLVVF